MRRQTPAHRACGRVRRLAEVVEIKLLRPRDPESKGITAGMNGLFRQRFMPGRDFRSPSDLSGQLKDWLLKANHPYSRSRHRRP
jgi:hypothetical protein